MLHSYKILKMNIMKKLLLLLFAVGLSCSVFAQGMKFEKGTFDEALAKAKKENKYVFMDAYTKWCGPCKALNKNVFPAKEAGDYFNKRFVNIKIDWESEEGKKLSSKYIVNGYPTLFCLDSDGKVLHSWSGGGNVERLINEAKRVFDATKTTAYMHKQYEEGNRDSEFLYEYIGVARQTLSKEKAYEITYDFLQTIPMNQLISEKNFNVIALSGIDFDNKYIKHVLENYQKYIESCNPRYVDAILYKKHDIHLKKQASETKSIKKLNKYIEDFKNMPYFQKKKSVNTFLVTHWEYYRANKLYQEAIDYSVNVMEQVDATRINGIKQTCLSIIGHYPDLINNDKLQKWGERQAYAMIKEDPEILPARFYLVKMYYQLKNKEKAIKYMNEFKDIQKKKNMNLHGGTKMMFDKVEAMK